MSETEQGQHADEALLHQLGYRQELNRRISGFTNFALSFTVISILAGTLTSYYIGFANGGPIMMSWGWPFVSPDVRGRGSGHGGTGVGHAHRGRSLLLVVQTRLAGLGLVHRLD